MPLLVVEKGHDKGKAIPVPSGGTVIIGRDSSTALPLRDTMTSRMHCKIQHQEDGYYLTDLESMNGTYLNGERVRETIKLDHGDLIKLGDTLFTFQSDESTATSLAGQRVGGYRIIERVGRGGMGTVYKAEQVDLQRVVALKVISEEHTKDKDFVDLFIHEARAAAKLNHPNVVQVYDVKRHNEYYYFSMEFVSGGSVQEVLNKQKKISPDQTVQMVLDAARGLDYAHKKGIVHRDVKPDNLMVSESGMIKIGDMGLARGLEEKVGPEEETSVIGTPHYIAPEQVLGRPADFRSDIYSLGATAYRMLAGVTPFSAPSVRDLVNKKVREDATAIVEHSPEVPKAVADVVARMMSRDPDRRYQTMTEVIADLERYQRGLAEAETQARREQSTAVTMLLSNRTSMWIAAAVLLLIFGGIAAIVFTRGPEPAEKKTAKNSAIDPQMANQALYVVRKTELDKMDRKDARSIEHVIADYASFIDHFPGTAAAREAAERKLALEGILRDAKADKKLEMAEVAEILQYRKAVEAFQPRKPDFGPIDAAITAYQDISKAEDAKGTVAAQEAAARATFIRRWKTTLEQRRDEYEQADAKADAAIRQKRFKDAAKIWSDFRDDTKRLESECPFAKDRYRTLLYDTAVASGLKRSADEARAAWPIQEQEARGLAKDGSYEAAIKLLEGIVDSTVDEIVPMARGLRDTLESEWASVTRKAEEEKEAAKAAALAKARIAFAQEAQAARELVLKYDFKGALQKIKALRDTNTADELRPRLERRVAELERCTRFKESLIAAIRNRGPSPSKFKVDVDPANFAGLEGAVEDADDRNLRIRLSAGGMVDHSWTQFDPPTFVKFVADQWKYNKEQRRDVTDQCDFAAVCMEFGLYERALEAMASVQELLLDPVAQVAPSAKLFCEEYVDRLKRGEAAEFSEIEARKRIQRLKDFMAAQKFPQAKAELDILHVQYWKTNEVQSQQQMLQEWEKRISKEAGESFNTAMKSDRYRAIQSKLLDEQLTARKAQQDIVLRLGRLDDPFEKGFHLGAVYSAAGDLRASTDRYADARRIGDALVQQGRATREFLVQLGTVYGELYRNAILQKNRKDADAIRNQGSQRFINPDTKAEEDWWTQMAALLANWSENVYPQEDRKLLKLREEIKATPEDPARIWALAQTCSDGVFNLSEARGYYAWLQENHPEFPQVQN
ncbi:MAG TPA: FHA domain-containing serine/threonine-protein kinase, partial [Planctomycetota bacterium]|nr:FHA domain-containing serine/threonine-protein kinase [Planctomycetota bacterium]